MPVFHSIVANYQKVRVLFFNQHVITVFTVWLHHVNVIALSMVQNNEEQHLKRITENVLHERTDNTSVF